MKHLKYIIPIIVVILITVFTVIAALWLIGLVPGGEWSDLIKAAIVVFIIGSILFILAWSAYFTYIIRESLKRNRDMLK